MFVRMFVVLAAGFSQDTVISIMVGVTLFTSFFLAFLGIRRLGRNPDFERLFKEPPERRLSFLSRVMLLGSAIAGPAFVYVTFPNRPDTVLIPLAVAALTVPVAPRNAPIIVACCLGLGYLLYSGESAIGLDALGAVSRRVSWSALFLMLLITPFAFAFRAYRIYLRPPVRPNS